MASGTYNQPAQNAPESERYVVQQLARAGRYLKMMELFGSLMVLGVGVLVFLLLVVVVDAWVIELGLWARLGVLLLLAGGSLAYFALVMLPLILHRINPAYAARTIEKSEPSLKNSLINFLSFRSHRGEVHQVVYNALEHRAAADLSHTQIESAVNHTRLVRIGYVLAGLLVLCGLYTVLSPKKPFATLQRILAPTAEIARPSVVQITDVEPGDAAVFHSDRVRIAARVNGLPSDTPVTLIYSTADGKAVDVEQQMALDGARYAIDFPPGEGGVQQDIRYRIEAGDARTQEYVLRMVPAPRITVTGLEYDYPAYTRLPDRVAEGEADIQAIEGTRVTIRARANQPIKAAYIEFDPEAAGATAPKQSAPMRIAGAEAHGTILLDLQADHRTPRHNSYQVRFVTEAGHRSRQPTVHRIEVSYDIDPEVEILSPKRNHIQVPVDGRETIEVRAIDPDYGLSRLELKATVGGVSLLNHALLEDAAGQSGQVVKSYEFVPAELRLEAGSRVMLWAVAADNRTAPNSGLPEPNTARTENYQIEIVAPERPRDEAAPPDKKDPEDPSKRGSEGEKSGDGSKTDGSKTDGSKAGGEGSKGDPSEGRASESGSEGSSGESGMEKSGESGSQGGSNNAGSDGASNSKGGGEAGNSGGEGGSSGGESSSTSSNSDSGNNGGSSGASGNSSSSEGSAGGERTERLHDGEVFERALEHQREQSGAGGNSGAGEHTDNPGDGSSSDGTGQENLKEKIPSGNNSGSQNNSSPQNDGNSGAQNNGGAQNDGGQENAGQSGSGEKNGGQQNGNNSGGNAGNNSPMSGGNEQGSQGNAGQGGNQQPMAGDGQSSNSGQNSAGQENAGQNNGGQNNGGQNNAGQQGNPSEGAGQSGSQSAGQQGDMQGGSQQPSGGGQSGDMPPKPNGSNGGGESSGGSQPGKKPGQQQPSGGGASGQNPMQQNSGSGASGGEPMNGQQNSGNGQGSTPMDGGSQQSGAGQQGAGDGGKQPGQGSAGGGEPSDQGSGSAPEKGDGETSGRPGDSKQGDGSSGNANGNQRPGAGGRRGDQGQAGGATQSDQQQDAGQQQDNKQGPQGNRPEKRDGAADDASSGASGGSRSTGSSGSSSAASGNSSSGQRTGAANPSNGNNSAGTRNHDPRPSGEAPEADKANLEYTKKATDLALEYLKDQKSKPDPELLEKLNMTKEELAQFVDRWESMKSKAREGESSDRDYTDALRSLGLRPQADKRRSVDAASDNVFGADSGARSEPPPAFAEQFRYFKSGRASGEDAKRGN